MTRQEKTRDYRKKSSLHSHWNDYWMTNKVEMERKIEAWTKVQVVEEGLAWLPKAGKKLSYYW